MVLQVLLIFPNQLYDDTLKDIKKYDHVFFVEDPVFFNERVKINKIKIAYLRAAGRCYFDKLPIVAGKKTYVEMKDVGSGEFLTGTGTGTVTMYDPTDVHLMKKWGKKCSVVLPSPNFIMPMDKLKVYAAGRVSARHSGFYNMVKQHLHILEDVPNQDKFNREGVVVGTIPAVGRYPMNKYYAEGIAFSQSQTFKGHVGEPENVVLYPITSKDAWLGVDLFVKERLGHFGRYQDAILKNEGVLYHANISAALNIGLLDPLGVVERAGRKRVGVASYEGFVRQVIGWREYMRYLYVFHYKELVGGNVAGNRAKVGREWWTGTTGLAPIDNEIGKALKTGYAHHIVRLMMFMNVLILSNVAPAEIYKWFMEVVSIDAYDWVMVGNIYGMGYFTNRFMSRPYLSTSAYIVKMSDYKRDGVWDVKWDGLFRSFIGKKPVAYVGAYRARLAVQHHSARQTESAQ